MTDDPAGVVVIACGTVCLELCGGLCLDFASITHTCTSRLCLWPFDPSTKDGDDDDDDDDDDHSGERDLLIPKSQMPGETTEAIVQQTQPRPYPTMSPSPSAP